MSTSEAADTSVRSTTVVDAPIERAFSVFTEGIGTWFPSAYNLLGVDIEQRIFEPRAGGKTYDRGTDGSECHWGRVLTYEPPNRVVFNWKISPTRQIEEDPDKVSEVEVRFTAESPERTRVDLVHSKLDRHGDGWEGVREAVGGDCGWTGCLNAFAEKVTA